MSTGIFTWDMPNFKVS